MEAGWSGQKAQFDTQPELILILCTQTFDEARARMLANRRATAPVSSIPPGVATLQTPKQGGVLTVQATRQAAAPPRATRKIDPDRDRSQPKIRRISLCRGSMLTRVLMYELETKGASP